MSGEQNPFVSGARVAVVTLGWGEPSYRECRVDKVYKTGRFTLVGSSQQWRPSSPGGDRQYWTADATGDCRWNRKHIKIWNEETDAEIAASIDRTKRTKKIKSLSERLAQIRESEITNDALDQIASLLPAREETGRS